MIQGYGCLASNVLQHFLPCGCVVIQLFLVWCASPHIHLDSSSPNFCYGTNESVSIGARLPSNIFKFPLVGGCREKGADSSQRGLPLLLPNFPEHREENGHISQNEYLRSIQDRQGQGKGSFLFSRWQCGLAWKWATNSWMYLQCFTIIPLTALGWDFILSIFVRFVNCSFSKNFFKTHFISLKNSLGIGSGWHIFVASTVIWSFQELSG